MNLLIASVLMLATVNGFTMTREQFSATDCSGTAASTMTQDAPSTCQGPSQNGLYQQGFCVGTTIYGAQFSAAGCAASDAVRAFIQNKADRCEQGTDNNSPVGYKIIVLSGPMKLQMQVLLSLELLQSRLMSTLLMP